MGEKPAAVVVGALARVTNEQPHPFICEWQDGHGRGCANEVLLLPSEFDRRSKHGRVLCDEHERKREKRTKVKNYARDDAGAIVTVREQSMHKLMTLHENGSVGESIRRIAQRVDELEGDWRVISVSTPRTILRDLNGLRERRADNKTGPAMSPEERWLSAIGRRDLLEPRTFRRADDYYRRAV